MPGVQEGRLSWLKEIPSLSTSVWKQTLNLNGTVFNPNSERAEQYYKESSKMAQKQYLVLPWQCNLCGTREWSPAWNSATGNWGKVRTGSDALSVRRLVQSLPPRQEWSKQVAPQQVELAAFILPEPLCLQLAWWLSEIQRISGSLCIPNHRHPTNWFQSSWVGFWCVKFSRMLECVSANTPILNKFTGTEVCYIDC